MCLRDGQAAETVVPRVGAQVLCSAHPLRRDQSTLSSAKGGVEGLLGSAGPPHAGRTCAAGGSISLFSCINQPQWPKPRHHNWLAETNSGQATTTKAQPQLWQGSCAWCGHVLPLCKILRDLTAV